MKDSKPQEIKAFYYCVKCRGEFDTAQELWAHREKELQQLQQQIRF